MIGVLIVLIIISILLIAINSVIINISNRISGSLGATNYKNKTGTCANVIDPIDNALYVVSIVRGISIFLLILGILVGILAVVALILGGEEASVSDKLKSAASKIKDVAVKNKSSFSSFIGSFTFVIVLLVILLIVFVGFIAVYGRILYDLNQIDKKCFTGSETDETTEIGAFVSAYQVVQANLIFCTVLATLFLIGIIIMIIYKVKSRTNPISEIELKDTS